MTFSRLNCIKSQKVVSGPNTGAIIQKSCKKQEICMLQIIMITLKLRDTTGTWHTFTGDSKLSISEQCEKHGIDSPFACRAGACTTCACYVRAGAEHLVQNRFGEKLIDTEENQFLTCIGGLHEGRVSSAENYEVVLDFVE